MDGWLVGEERVWRVLWMYWRRRGRGIFGFRMMSEGWFIVIFHGLIDSSSLPNPFSPTNGCAIGWWHAGLGVLENVAIFLCAVRSMYVWGSGLSS